MNAIWHSRKRRNTGKACLTMLILSLLLFLSGCSSKQIVCQPPEIPRWMTEQVPLELNLHEPLFKALQE